MTPRLKEKLGEHVGKGNLVAEVYELERVTPEIVISEKEIGEVKRGQPVILRARAYPETSFAGTVKAISPIAADSNGPEWKVFRVMVEMAETTNLLRSEMTGSAKIFCGRRSIFHLLTRRLARSGLPAAVRASLGSAIVFTNRRATRLKKSMGSGIAFRLIRQMPSSSKAHDPCSPWWSTCASSPPWTGTRQIPIVPGPL